jgi:hypothetical protein
MKDSEIRRMAAATGVVLDEDALLACTDVVGRTGAKSFQIGWLNDPGTPKFKSKGPEWYAYAEYDQEGDVGSTQPKILVGGLPGPTEAADGLSRRLLDGGRCTHCNQTITLLGTEGCRWTRNGRKWEASCPESKEGKKPVT